MSSRPLPLRPPGMAAIAIFIFVFVWNDYLVGTVLATTEDMKTVQKGIVPTHHYRIRQLLDAVLSFYHRRIHSRACHFRRLPAMVYRWPDFRWGQRSRRFTREPSCTSVERSSLLDLGRTSRRPWRRRIGVCLGTAQRDARGSTRPPSTTGWPRLQPEALCWTWGRRKWRQGALRVTHRRTKDGGDVTRRIRPGSG